MIFKSSQKCPNCGRTNAKDTVYCNWCGQLIGIDQVVHCSKCGQENRAGANFCKNCGEKINQNAAAGVYGHRWGRGEQDFAIRIDSENLEGLLMRGLIIEPGTNAMLIERGENKGMLPPGQYTLENIAKKGWDWLTTGVSEQATVLLVDVTPSELQFHLGGRLTQDGLPTGISLRVQVQVNDPGKFLINVLKGQKNYSLEDLRLFLYPEVAQVADAWLRSHKLQEIVENPRSREEIALAIEENLRKTFAQSGLVFTQLRTAEMNLEPYDNLQKKRSKYSLQLEEFGVEEEGRLSLEDAKVKSREKWIELTEKLNLAELAEEEQKVTQEEHKAELYQRMRQAVMSDRMNEVRSEAEFEKFLDELDYEKLLRKKEREDLLRDWREQGEDHERALAFLLAKAEIEESYELRRIELKLAGDLEDTRLDTELALRRKQADYEYEERRRHAQEQLELARQQIRIQQEREQAELEREKNKIELSSLQRQADREDDFAEAMSGMEILARMKEIRRTDEELTLQIRRLDEEERLRIRREDELKRLWEMHKIEIEKRIQVERERQAEREHEIERMRNMKDMPAEVLIAVSPPTQAAVIAELKKLDAYKEMDSEQILVLSAKGDPGLAQALQEKFKAAAEGKISEREKQLYETLLRERADENLRQRDDARQHKEDLVNSYERGAERNTDLAKHALDRQADTSQAFATGKGGQPIVVVPGGNAPQIVNPGQMQQNNAMNQMPATKNCPVCALPSPVDVRYCQHCGTEFKGMK